MQGQCKGSARALQGHCKGTAHHFLCFHPLGQTFKALAASKVAKLEAARHRGVRALTEHILWLDIAVGDAMDAMQMSNGRRELDHHEPCSLLRSLDVGVLQCLTEVSPLHVRREQVQCLGTDHFDHLEQR